MVRDEERRERVREIVAAGGRPSHIVVFLYLAGRANRDRVSFPKQSTIAEDNGFTVRGVQKLLGWLEVQGFIQTVKRGKMRNYLFPQKANPGSPIENPKANPGSGVKANPGSPDKRRDHGEEIVGGGVQNRKKEIFEHARSYLTANLARLGATIDNARTRDTVDAIAEIAAEAKLAGRGIGLRRLVGTAETREKPFGWLYSEINYQTGDQLKRRLKAVTDARRAA